MMTNAKAIEMIRNDMKLHHDSLSGEYRKALKKAVEALEAQEWIPCSERLPEEDHWLGGSGKQFSDNVLISIVNRDDEDAWVQVSQTIDGTWALELPRYCKVIAWMPLPEPYAERRTDVDANT